MHLLYHSSNAQDPAIGALRDPDDDAIYAHDPGLTLRDWAEGLGTLGDDVERLVLHDRVGHLGQQPDQDAESWIRSWSQSGWEGFDSTYAQGKARAQAHGIELLIRPGCEGMLSDAVSTLSWCTRGGGQDAKLLLDPLGWVVPSMMRDLDDHLDRICDLCLEMIDHGRVGLVLLRSLKRSDDPGRLESASLRGGEPDAGTVLDRLDRLLTRSERLAVLDEKDLALLGAPEGPIG